MPPQSGQCRCCTRFLFDQSTDRRLAPYLRNLGHDVTVVAVDYPEALPDEQVLAIEHQEQRILVTEDRDFGELVFRHQRPHLGVIYLRLPPMDLQAKIARLHEALAHHTQSFDQFLVVAPRSVRVQRAKINP
ncbi:MAG: hypothetical protein EPO21_04720 [Chloroflexota bacterium]|nr:MAG: hypothetical protein EPO21_04720 [Chloroflexota bacterium]